jgi:hypothetical protein
MIGVENSWRMRWPFTLAMALAAFGIVSAWVIRRNSAARSAYESVATQFEAPFLPPGFDGDMIGKHMDLPDGRREVEWAAGWRDVGPLVSGLASGSWSTLAPDGSIRARYEMRAGEREGPCEFQDATGTRRVKGQYRADRRIGLWTLENVLGEGRTLVYFGS